MSDWAQPGADAIMAGGTMPVEFFMLLHTDNPGDAGVDNVATDARRIGPLTMAPRDPVVPGSVANDNYVEILNATTTEDVTHVSYWDSSSAGVCYFIDELAQTLSIEAAQTVAAAIGQCVVGCSLWS